MRTLLLRVVLVVLAVVFIVHVGSLIPRCVFCLLPVEPVFALGLSELVNFGSSKTGDYFLRKLVVDDLACYKFMISATLP